MHRAYLLGTACILTLASLHLHAETPDHPLPQVWHFAPEHDPTRNPPSLTDPLIEKGIVYFGDTTGAVRAMDLQQDKTLWQTAAGSYIHALLLDDKHVYATGTSGLAALNKENGKLAWQLESIVGVGDCARDPTTDMLYVAGMDGLLYALDRNTGERKWTHTLLDDKVHSSPDARIAGNARPSGIATDGAFVFQSIFDQSRLVACDAATGDIKWSFLAKGWILPAPTFDDRRVFIGTQDGCLYCLEKISGEVEWKLQTNGRIESTPLLLNDLVIVPSCDGFIYAAKKTTGELAWKFETALNEKQKHYPIYSAPLLAKGLVWIAAADGHLYGIDPATGAAAYAFRPSPDSDLYASPAADDRFLVITSRRKPASDLIHGPPPGENAVWAFKFDE